ncbi:uncharacterized protein MONBRDRAFT_33223 [Monosiga brevicollis MX1]|uniref:Fascin n=1 Tax=Monosiga brevicollis TaxID=81824 RepID=A9V487_MONBE|nr:uncharacterized protein MONBRDRAFT_33223 [Monosiga brevicollis MX1]EDQ87663.1 predicted protein [Monosiga brevicollis MX1]|eukprot:XP_001747583.1 hypothetical protein [Monosiga brevicollis MX1]
MTMPTHPGQLLPWAFGLRNHEGLYLTVEPFGNRINVSSKVMKNKQIFVFEQPDGAGSTVALRTHQGRYLSATSDGRLESTAESIGENERFELVPDDSGRFALLSSAGFYVGGHGEHVDAYGRTLAEDRYFHLNLALHPQMNIWNVNRKTFMHLNADGQRVTTDEVIPWGDDAVMSLQFVEETNRYTIQAANGKFLDQSGSLVEEAGPTAQYGLRLLGGQVAFQAANGRFLSSIGGDGVCKATKPGPPGKDELYVFEDSQPQIKMTAWFGKKVSVAVGTAILASQSQTGDAEQFQLEVGDDGRWALRTHKNLFCYINGNGDLMGDSETKTQPEARFQLEFFNEKLALRASNGAYITAKKNGSMAANGHEPTEEALFVYEMTNRPRLVLRTKYGFLNMAGEETGNLMCNRAQPTVFHMHVKAGHCQIKGPNGRYFAPSDDYSKLAATSVEPTSLFLEFVSLSKFAIRVPGPAGETKYAKVHQNGAVSADATRIDESTLFEY